MSRDPLSHEPSFVDRHDHSEAPARRSPVSEDPRYDPVEESEPRRSSDLREGPETDNAVRGYYMRERTYILRESEFRTLVEIGKFRVVEASDLAQFGYAGDARRMSRDLRRLEQQSLVARESLYSTRGAKQVLVLTKRAKKLLEDSRRIPPAQAIYYGLVNLREAEHDAALYRLYQRERARIEQEGGRPLRVALDYELRRNLHRDLAELDPSEPEARRQVAERHALSLVEDKIQVPDLRLEYETADYVQKQVDLELATRNYRPRALAQKVQAGFSIYAPREDASKLRRILSGSGSPGRIFSL